MCSWPAVRRGNSKELNEREQLYGLKTSAEISAAGHGTAGKSWRAIKEDSENTSGYLLPQNGHTFGIRTSALGQRDLPEH